MPRIYAENVDVNLLHEQITALAEIQQYLTTGDVFASADGWHDALEGLLNLLAVLARSAK